MAELKQVQARPAGWRIGITQRRIAATSTSFARDALDADWSTWFAARGLAGAFVSIPNFADASHAARYAESWGLNLLLLSGGEDLGLSPERDATEDGLLAYARRTHMPVIGVCRGMQLLHARSGGLLLEDAGHVGYQHSVALATEVVHVNSWHRWVIKELAPGWQALATAHDGSIEAMQHERLPWLATMWHPERTDGQADMVWQWIDNLQGLRPGLKVA